MTLIPSIRLCLSSLLVGSFALTSGCVITISDDLAAATPDDEQAETPPRAGETGTTPVGDTTTTDGETTTETTTDGDTTGETTGETTETGGDECAPMNAANGPEECFMPRGWFWNGEACEQILCTCDGPDCNALFPNEAACVDVYGQCLPVPPPSCDPQLAEGVGLCELFLGWKWDGVDCVGLSGCNCEGPDCANLYADPDQCKAEHAECGPPDVCEPDDAIGSGDCDLFLGVIWTGDNCLGISGCECIGTDCANLPLDESICWDEHALCELADPCAAEDALGVGPCEQFFGYAWNGLECVGQSGCDCVGLDCEFLDLDLAVCEAEHAECGGGGVPPCPGVTDAVGVGLCDLFLGWAWNGMTCEPLSGCACQGADCDNLYPELGICELETAGCQ